jgi:glycerol-3-phosphate O-acyltransferase
LQLQQQHYHCADLPQKLTQLKLLAHNSNDILQRYAIVLNLLQQQQRIERSALELGSQQLAQRLLTMHGIDAPEYHDKQLFATLVDALKDAGYLAEADDSKLQPAQNFAPLLSTVNALVLPEVLQTIRQITAES